MTNVVMQGDYASASHGCSFETSPDCKNSEVSKRAGKLESDRKRGVSSFGTLSAINRLHLGEAPKCPIVKGRGGARNRADKPSQALTEAHIANLVAAERHSGLVGLPFTRMITIHWRAAGVPLEGMASATGTFIDKLTKWLARRRHRTAWLWVHENAGEKGWHCHILMHIPSRVVRHLPAAQKRWLRQITGRAYSKRIIRSGPIGRRLALERSNPELHRANSKAALAYLLKGANQSAAKVAGLKEPKAQGLILGRRCSTSQNIGKAARAMKGQ